MPVLDPRPVRLTAFAPTAAPSDQLDVLVAQATDLVGSSPEVALAWAAQVGADVPTPGSGRTALRWELLASLGALDLTLARALEPHLDALAVLDEEGTTPAPGSTWGVYAAEGPGPRLVATGDGSDWSLTGRKPWCSLASLVSHALITAWVDDERRGLFEVDLRHEGVSVEETTWVPAGLREVATRATVMEGVPARPVGEADWYLRRSGFAWGGIGVAAVWFGGAVGLARRLERSTREREPDQIALMHLGAVDTALAGARAALAESAAVIDTATTSPEQAVLLAGRVRNVVAEAADAVLRHVAHALGPAPLSQEPEHVARVSDLSLYLRQHHGERDLAAVGRQLAQGGSGPSW